MSDIQKPVLRAPYDASEDIGSNPSTELTLVQLAERRLTRRQALRGMAATAIAGAVAPAVSSLDAFAQEFGPSTFTFKEMRQTYDGTHHVAEGYDAQVLIRWGDAVVPDAPAFDPRRLSAGAQAMQFGYNCDYISYHPLPLGSQSSDNGLLFVNHEYTNTNLIFPGIGEGRAARTKANKAQSEIELAAHGASVVEVKKTDGRWEVVADSAYNRRITGLATEIAMAGPAAGHEKLKTKADPTGRKAIGTLNNCGGGVTPWGTVLTAEENFNGYFGGDADKMPDAALYKRYGVTKDSWYSWVQHIERFDVGKEPNEPNRFGWIVEIDPYEPASTPVKRTALGRFKHEAATCVVNPDGRVVIYSGDDERFEYVYKFVTKGTFNPTDRAANRTLLDEGTLYVARFGDEGQVRWMPLVHGEGPLTAANGFASQADILIDTRRAADLLKATPMDRPEDIEPSPDGRRVYVVLTNNTSRKAEQVDKINPRANNRHGHIVEIIPPGGARPDHAALDAKWEMFLMCGKPGVDQGALYHRATSDTGWFTTPDNIAFDSRGRMWIATDGAPGAAGIADGLWATDTRGPGRALPKLFFQAPRGAEVCAPILTPDDRTMFVTIQHPAEEDGSTYESPSTRWPDFRSDLPVRPSVVVVTRKDGGVIGS